MLNWLLLCLLICNGDSADVLLSRNRETNGSIATAWRATDGNYDGNEHHKSCFYSHEKDKHKWWLVILDAVSVLSRVVIYSRTDCCTHRTQYLSFFASYDRKGVYDDDCSDFYRVQYYHGPPPQGEFKTVITFNRLVAKTIGISKPFKAEALQLCEFEIYGHEFKKLKSITYFKYGPFALYNNVTSIKQLMSISTVECATICLTTVNCVSFTTVSSECLIFNHAGGSFVAHGF